MKDLIFNFAYSILQLDLRDPHDIPFALPLVFCAFLGFTLGFIFLKFIDIEHKQENNLED